MLVGMWNYAIKAANVDATADFYVNRMGAELRSSGMILGCRYKLIRMGQTRVIIFDRAPYEDSLGLDLPPGFLHVVYEVDDHDAHIQRLRNAGIRFIMEPQTIEVDFGVRKIAFFEAPDGIRTEVMQILADSGTV
jgi:catechol 2,3-dioxygenase-like lactoylglutathione lyase family enzyme